MSKETFPHLQALRDVMRSKQVDAVIIPGTDPHLSETPNQHWKLRDYVTGFTGSAGTVAVTQDKAGLWTDSRYFLQAAQQLEQSGVDLYRDGLDETVNEWLAAQLGDGGGVVGIDGRLFSMMDANRLEQFCGENGLQLAPDFFAAWDIWTDRPAEPADPALVMPLDMAGEDVASKIERTVAALAQRGADCMLVTALDEVAWLLNLRGSDVDYTPVVTAMAVVGADETVLFAAPGKVTAQVQAHLKEAGVKVKDYGDVSRYLERIKERHTILLDPDRVSDALGQCVMCGRVYAPSPIAALKGVKNEVEIAGFRAAHLREGVALVRAIKWAKDNAGSGITEQDVDNRLQQLRAESPEYRGDSFHTIAGYGANGAIVHYQASPSEAATLQRGSMLLVDTGGQYTDGTTDATRTVALGTPTPQEQHDFTLVLKGHLALARAVFPEGTRGDQLDALARMPLWTEGKTYLHGTGHGVGHMLCCHEGPHSIRTQHNPTTLQLGMITSNEPGLYVAGKYGIRTENLMLVVKAEVEGEFGDFYRFEQLTLAPYDLALVDRSMLTATEVEQINAYHALVRERLLPLLTGADAQWLEQATQPVE